MDDTQRKRREVLMGLCGTAIINLGLGFVPGFAYFIWIIEWAYILPIAAILFFVKRNRIAVAMFIMGGVTVVLDVAYCGYATSHGGGL